VSVVSPSRSNNIRRSITSRRRHFMTSNKRKTKHKHVKIRTSVGFRDTIVSAQDFDLNFTMQHTINSHHNFRVVLSFTLTECCCCHYLLQWKLQLLVVVCLAPVTTIVRSKDDHDWQFIGVSQEEQQVVRFLTAA
jgi:hypothetical protein